MLLLLFIFAKEIKPPKKVPQEKSISLNIQQFNTPKAIAKALQKPIINSPIPQTKTPLVKNKKTKKPIDNKKHSFALKAPKENNITKVVTKKRVKKKHSKKSKRRVTKKRKTKRVKRTKKTQPSLAQTLLNAGRFLPTYTNTRTSQSSSMIRNFYGREFNTYTSTQKNFIRQKLGLIHKITQRTLTRNGYPRVAIYTQQQGTNIVSFYLQPNGDISNLRIKTSSGYTALDKNTLKVIKIAYKDYPLPNTKTKIIFNVEYRIY